MPLETTSGSAVESLALNQLFHWDDGDAWDTGCDVTLAPSTENIAVDISAGSVFVGGVHVDVNAQQKILDVGDNEYYRKDLLVVDAEGSVDVIPGTPAPIQTDYDQGAATFDPVYHAYSPSPDELDGMGGQYVALAVVWVPPDATSSSDLDGDITYVQDRRLKNPANAVTPLMIDALADADGSVQTNHLTDAAVTTAKLQNNAVTAAKLAADAVDLAAIAQNGATDGQVIQWDSTADAWTVTTIAHYSDENAQDAVGSILSDSFAYDDTAPGIDLASGGVSAGDIDLTTAFDFTGALQHNGSAVRTDADLAAEAIAEPESDTWGVAANDSYAKPVFVPDGSTLTVFAWGLRLSDGMTDPAVTLTLLDPSGTSQGSIDASVAPNYAEDTAGVATYANSSGSTQVAHLEVSNTGSTDYTRDGSGVGIEMTLAYRVA